MAKKVERTPPQAFTEWATQISYAAESIAGFAPKITGEEYEHLREDLRREARFLSQIAERIKGEGERLAAGGEASPFVAEALKKMAAAAGTVAVGVVTVVSSHVAIDHLEGESVDLQRHITECVVDYSEQFGFGAVQQGSASLRGGGNLSASGFERQSDGESVPLEGSMAAASGTSGQLAVEPTMMNPKAGEVTAENVLGTEESETPTHPTVGRAGGLVVGRVQTTRGPAGTDATDEPVPVVDDGRSTEDSGPTVIRPVFPKGRVETAGGDVDD